MGEQLLGYSQFVWLNISTFGMIDRILTQLVFVLKTFKENIN